MGPPQQQADLSFSIAYRKFSYVWSMVLLIFATVIMIYTIAKEWTNPPWNYTNPAGEIIIFLLLLTWIALLEGCQISIVGLQAINIELYKKTHPRAYQVLKLAHKGPNVERFLVGRQFLLLFNGFLVTKVSGADGDEFYIGDWHWTREAANFFWKNSVLLMIVIIVPGQLVSQLMAAEKMLGFLNLPFFGYYTVLLPCLIMESTGLVHSSYMLKDVLCRIGGIDVSKGGPKKRMSKDFLYYSRVLISISAVIFSGLFIIKGLANKQTNATDGPGWNKLPGWAAIIMTLFFLFIMACAEGLQVSALALAKTHTASFKDKSPLAYRTTQLLYAGRNMQAFLVGRQTIVAMMTVLLARVTSYAGSDGELLEGGDWGMGKGFNQWLLQTGILGAVLVCNVAQLASQVTASIFPVELINNHVMHILLRLMLLIEASGVVNACWPLAWGVDSLFGLEHDPFDGDETVKTPAQNVLERKKSMGIPTQRGVSPFDLHQPEAEYHMDYTYKVSYI
nr:silicon transporter alpha A [Stephanoeca diplocostata]